MLKTFTSMLSMYVLLHPKNDLEGCALGFNLNNSNAHRASYQSSSLDDNWRSNKGLRVFSIDVPDAFLACKVK